MEYRLRDFDGNTHVVYNFTFFRNGALVNKPFINKFDPLISNTIIQVVNDFFSKREDKALVYFCFDDDGFGRHRNITFKKWAKSSLNSLEYYYKTIKTYENEFNVALVILKDNPLKTLVINAFENEIKQLMELLK